MLNARKYSDPNSVDHQPRVEEVASQNGWRTDEGNLGQGIALRGAGFLELDARTLALDLRDSI